MDQIEQENLVAQVWRDARRSTIHIGAVLVGCTLFALAAGALNPEAPAAWSKVLSVTGGVLAAWGGYFALHDGRPSWKGSRPDEVMRARIFKASFLTGVFFGLAGAMW